MNYPLSPEIEVELSEPVVVALAQPGERRWGVHQFPALSRLPDKSILVMYADAPDSHATHGKEAPAFVSRDEGKTWEPYAGALNVIRPHFSISAVYNDEYLVAPAQPYLNWREENITLPQPVSQADIYGPRSYYALEDLPVKLRSHFGVLYGQRYTPQTNRWAEEDIRYDNGGRIITRHGTGADGDILPQTFLERALLKHGGELFYAEYRGQYRTATGHPPIKGILTCMVSTDNGRTFQRRSTISADPSGHNLRGEGNLAATTDGRLVCLLRQQDQVVKPMKICWSSDRGKTWTESKDLFTFGVFPCVLSLDNGIMALSYGRPGVWLSFAADGTGEQWSEPLPVIGGSQERVTEHSCGYTSLLPLGEDSFLLAYSDFLHRRPDDETCKAILVRAVAVRRRQTSG